MDKKSKAIIERMGGAMPMRLRDADTGETVYDNRDATAMAKQFVARGGHASDAAGPELEYLKIEAPCSECHKIDSRFFGQAMKLGFLCYNCNEKSKPITIPKEDKEKIDGYVMDFLTNKDKDKLEKLMNEYIKANVEVS